METKNIYSLKSKVALYVILSFIILFIINIFLIRHLKTTIIKDTEIQLVRQGESYAKIITKSETAILNDLSKGGKLHNLLKNLADSASNTSSNTIKYIMILNNNNSLIMHSDFSKVGSKYTDKVTETASKSSQAGYMKYLDNRGNNIYDCFTPLISSSSDGKNGKIGYIRIGMATRLNDKISAATSNYTTTSAIFFFFSLILAIILLQRLATPVTDFIQQAKKVSSGDLTSEININTKDELNTLSFFFNKIISNFSSLAGNVRKTCSGLTKIHKNIDLSSKEILSNSEKQSKLTEKAQDYLSRIDVSVKNVYNNLEHLSGFTRDNLIASKDMQDSNATVIRNLDNLTRHVQAAFSPVNSMLSSENSISSDVKELAETIAKAEMFVSSINTALPKIEKDAKEAVIFSSSVTKSTNEIGLSSVQNSIEGIQRIKSTVRRATEVVDKLGNRSMEIDKILTVINEIAEQTNLLALNAAILASEAGEHGRGFNVVATEIRELSERTAMSTKEIDKLIKTVISEVNEAIDVMNQSSTYVDEGERLSNETYSALSTILKTSQDSSAKAKAIEEETSLQVQGMMQMINLFKYISNKVTTILKATEEQAVKGKEVSTDTAIKLKNKSVEMQRNISSQSALSKKISAAISDYSQMLDNMLNAIVQHAEENKHLSDVIKGLDTIAEKNAATAYNIADIYDSVSNETTKVDKLLNKINLEN
ncbi:methyl-accepting chemotaxis protein [Thermodesulfobacteriota bacterium]